MRFGRATPDAGFHRETSNQNLVQATPKKIGAPGSNRDRSIAGKFCLITCIGGLSYEPRPVLWGHWKVRAARIWAGVPVGIKLGESEGTSVGVADDTTEGARLGVTYEDHNYIGHGYVELCRPQLYRP